ncbi:fatty acid oxidation complex subunit alpha FadB [Paraferrimonas sedimenticola]|uniref:enoyl-CoA hydratase n=1 Tax=Paraferrimonas sedimenticola TaxID=375674 RepID=A0AA37RYJ3_9GAMM|nr:fatty acid oxidation complex subunit alpha FadB [Paraferrimonas sedimenticola]GLP97686.1 fatty acid oxidation complex subunit alpha [Paraferrimonas sedimenticola]
MIYQSPNIQVSQLDNQIAELRFNAPGSVNKFDKETLNALNEALAAIEQAKPRGVLVTSGKSVFIVGADITEFTDYFAQPDDVILDWISETNAIFNRLEDLPMPTVCAINGFALGGGFEAALSCDLRIVAESAQVGLPETKLGLIPGFGGTVRLPRVIGADNALEWMTSGKHQKAAAALKVGAVDAVVADDKLIEQASVLLERAISEEIDWQARRQAKLSPLTLSKLEATMAFTTARGMVAKLAGKHYPAPMTAVDVVETAAGAARAEALEAEKHGFLKLARTDAAAALIGIFLNDQLVKGKAKKMAKASGKVESAAVLGAGIMGGGIAYQSAYKGVPIVMKDIAQEALDLGLSEASKIAGKLVEKGRSTPAKMAKTLNNIVPTLDYSGIANAQVVVEAVVENPKIKAAVLKETETKVADNAVITSNTSTISIDLLAESLDKPERFCGMHFFNPVHRMPLVEVIRSKYSSEDTINQVVAYATQMGKTAIVVNDCPGFFVNRVLFPYVGGFNQLIADGAEIADIDKVMEKDFGWPMGPAYLMDVVGIDTAHHCQGVMAEGFPERMAKPEVDLIAAMFEANRYGQKNKVGFYQYQKDKRGRTQKVADDASQAIIEAARGAGKSFSKEDIIARCMIPMIIETVRCLEEGIVDSPAEADMALLYGLGFPAFRGGVFRYLDTMGVAKFVELADSFAHLGPLYQVTQGLRDKAASNGTYY